MITDLNKILEREDILSRVSGEKKTIVKYLLDGYNFNQIRKVENISKSRIYKIKKELQDDFKYLLEKHKDEVIAKNRQTIRYIVNHAVDISKGNTLSGFFNYFILDYDEEALVKGWKSTAFQDTLYNIWENNMKSCVLAPREHLKTTSVIGYIIKKIFERKYPLEVNYYHLVKEMAQEKFRKMRLIIEKNPILSMNFGLKELKKDTQTHLELKDGTIIKPMSWEQGSVGKHPHLIILDDVIDRKVMYSDDRNKKSIDRFYTDIYPQISKKDEEKKIIIIGTAQREDDLYSSLPSDFKKYVFQAIRSDGTPLSPELFSLEDLERIKSDISEKFGTKYWLKEYMNVPFNARGDIIKREWIQRVKDAPKGLDIYQGWDLGVGKDPEKGDYTAGITIGIKSVGEFLFIYVLDVFRKRLDFDARLKAIVEQFNKWHPLKIGIEANVFQYDTVQTLKKRTNLPIIGIKTIKNKVEKFTVDLAPHFENKKVFILYGDKFDVFVNELLSLPFGEHDDMADGMTLAIKVSSLQSEVPIIDFL